MRILSLFLVVVTLASCGCGNGSSNHKNLKVFKYNQASGIASLDPAFSKDQATIWACNQLFNSLVQLDDNLQIQPAIAKSWTISEDGLTYTFALRNDVYFHNDSCFADKKGRRVVASDVVFSLTRITDNKVASPGAWIFNGKVAAAEPFVAVNDSTFQVKLSKPFPPLLGILSMQYCSVIPAEALTLYGSGFRAHPVGTGPFKFKNWKEGNALVMLKNENYFEELNGKKLPFIDGIKVSFIDNKKTEFLSFKQKELDFISGLDASYIDEVLEDNGELKKDLVGKFSLLKTAYLNTEYLGFLTTGKDEAENPFLNKKLRQALNYGFDRRELIRFLRNGVGKPAESGFTPYGLPSYDAEIKGYAYDAAKAKELLKESGYDTKKTLTLYTNETYKDIALFISKQLEQIGLKTKVELSQPAILREWMSQGKINWFRGSWLADYPDAENYFAVFYSGNGAPPNYTRFSNKAFDKLYEQALVETDDAKRYALYHDMDKIIIEEAPVIPLFYDEVLRFSQNNIKGLTPNALNLLNLKAITIE